MRSSLKNLGLHEILHFVQNDIFLWSWLLIRFENDIFARYLQKFLKN